MSTDRIIRYAYYGIIAILAIVGLSMILRGTDEKPNVDLSLWQGIVYAIIAAGATLVFAVIGLVTHFKGNVKAIISVVALGLIYLIGKSMASSEVPQKLADEGITSGVLTASHAGVIVSVVLIGIAIAITLASGVRSLMN
ncbi:MAG: hypothetical protein H6608_06580 [Flavobacteriales bacterium]|nr:hypothetical protein [Bacteroidota bacterium]MCB9240775.1 hypothetical protein [Flavobacteriales bacterium]